MTFEDDMLVFITKAGARFQRPCATAGVDWPPPAELLVANNGPAVKYKLHRFSAITDEQRQAMKHVCRGAEYREQ